MTAIIVSAIISAIISALLTIVLIRIEALHFSRAGELNGRWFEVLPASRFKPYDRHDDLIIRQRGNQLKGEITRTYPQRERGQQWRLLGYVDGARCVAIFFTTTRARNAASYGTITMYREPRNPRNWVGTYTRPEFESKEALASGELPEFVIRWQRQPPEPADSKAS